MVQGVLTLLANLSGEECFKESAAKMPVLRKIRRYCKSSKTISVQPKNIKK